MAADLSDAGGHRARLFMGALRQPRPVPPSAPTTGLTRENSNSSEWYSAFSRIRSLVILSFKDGRQLVGWPKEWPSHPSSGHFLTTRGTWLINDNESVPTDEYIDAMLVPASDINMVEFLRLADIDLE